MSVGGSDIWGDGILVHAEIPIFAAISQSREPRELRLQISVWRVPVDYSRKFSLLFHVLESYLFDNQEYLYFDCGLHLSV